MDTPSFWLDDLRAEVEAEREAVRWLRSEARALRRLTRERALAWRAVAAGLAVAAVLGAWGADVRWPWSVRAAPALVLPEGKDQKARGIATELTALRAERRVPEAELARLREVAARMLRPRSVS